MTKVALLDYGMGNLHSAGKALTAVGADVSITRDPAVIAAADKIVFPGVGAMRDCMAEMQAAGIADAVKTAVFNKPVMAICVGMQALFERSEENDGVDCLGVLGGDVKRFDDHWLDDKNERIKVPIWAGILSPIWIWRIRYGKGLKIIPIFILCIVFIVCRLILRL